MHVVGEPRGIVNRSSAARERNESFQQGRSAGHERELVAVRAVNNLFEAAAGIGVLDNPSQSVICKCVDGINANGTVLGVPAVSVNGVIHEIAVSAGIIAEAA